MGPQIADWRRVISYLETLDDVDSDRIGIWGTSYAGGHAIVLGATDRRLSAVVAQVPVIEGFATGQWRVPDARAALEREFDADERAQLADEPPATRALVSDDPAAPAFYRDPHAVSTYLSPLPDGVTFENRATPRSMRWTRMYRQGQWIDQVSPTPLMMMIVARGDTTSGTDLQLRGYGDALEPKRLVLLDGDHFDPYVKQLAVAVQAAGTGSPPTSSPDHARLRFARKDTRQSDLSPSRRRVDPTDGRYRQRRTVVRSAPFAVTGVLGFFVPCRDRHRTYWQIAHPWLPR